MAQFSCSVCDDELTSVSTLHYHQMCLHTTEELSLAILSLRELPVHPSPSGGGESSGNTQSPSTDCEDKLLRNGLAKYPRFLLASGDRKQKLLNVECKNILDSENSASHKIRDKENIINNKCTGDDNSDKSNEGIKESLSTDPRPVEPPCESFRSRLWGTIKTLDGKTVEAPVVKIDTKRQVLKPCYVGLKETSYVSKSTDKANSRLNISHDSVVGSSTVPKKNIALVDLNKILRKGYESNLPESENSCQLINSENNAKNQDDRTSQGFQLEKKPSESVGGSSVSSDGGLAKGNIFEKQLEMMNMSSFDDVIELECSEESDDERERSSENEFDEGDESSENEEVEREIMTEKSLSKDNLETEVAGYKDRRVCKKQKSLMSVDKVTVTENLQQIQSLEGNELGCSSAPHRISKENMNLTKKSIEKSVHGSKVSNNQNNGMESMNDELAAGKVVGGKVYSDSCVQTDRLFPKNSKKCTNAKGELHDKRKVTPKKKNGKRKMAKKDSSFIKSKRANVLPKIEDTSKYEEVIVKAEVVEQGNSVPVTAVIVNGEKRFFCDQCNKTYKKRSHLDRHKRVHTGERPFVCSYCEKGFSVRSILNQHIRIHTGEKPYSCSICAARFPQKSGLMTHMMLHTGKPFKCDQCDKSFVSNHKLIHHLKGHDGDRPYICDECNSAFFTAAALNDHKQMHSRSRKLVCKRCNASFVHEVYLKIHLATHVLEHESPVQKETVSKDSSERCTSSLPPLENANELSLSIDALDQFCNGETIMMDLSV